MFLFVKEDMMLFLVVDIAECFVVIWEAFEC